MWRVLSSIRLSEMSFAASLARICSRSLVADDELPGGTATGTMLHEILENIPLNSLDSKPKLEDWLLLDPVKEVFATAIARNGIVAPGRSAPACWRNDLSCTHDQDPIRPKAIDSRFISMSKYYT